MGTRRTGVIKVIDMQMLDLVHGCRLLMVSWDPLIASLPGNWVSATDQRLSAVKVNRVADGALEVPFEELRLFR